jgi:predicted TIM-barrel fold metal-dependent hydrolase
MQRRHFLARIAAASASGALVRPAAAAQSSPRAEFIDTNVWLSPWPTRRTPIASTVQLVARLRRHGVTAAWAGSLDGALYSDLAQVNAQLAESCTRDGGGILRPFGSVNPTLPDWEDDLRRCQEVHRMAGVRTFPSYHGFTLDDPRFARLVDLCGQRGLLLQIAMSIEDDRMQNPILTAAPVVAAPLVEVLKRFPRARVMLLNGGYRVIGAPLMARLVSAGVWFEIANLEGVAGIAAMLRSHPSVRLSFGSHLPCFYFEAALLKLQESALSSEQLAALRFRQAEAALAPA